MSPDWYRRVFGSRSQQSQNPVDDLVDRFGQTCPVCGAVLGATTPRDPRTDRYVVPPCLRLEVGAPNPEGLCPWRVSTLDGKFPPATSTNPAFTSYEVEFIYLICGGGHIFPDATPVFQPGHDRTYDSRQYINSWNMVAMIGAPASGKTYLLLRTLRQSLDNQDNLAFDNEEGRVNLRELTPLEEVPLAVRRQRYDETRSTGLAIPPTNSDNGTPAGILEAELPDALAAIRELISRTVLDGTQRAEIWGKGMRQPLVVRADAYGRRTWTGVADLPGELFRADQQHRRETVKLRAYDALVWAVDPLIAANALDWLVKDGTSAGGFHGLFGDPSVHANVLDGSLRPGTSTAVGSAVVRRNRDDIQLEIGQRLAVIDGQYATEGGNSLELLIAVTKCDLIHAALSMKRLEDLGDPGLVLRGVTAYLLFKAMRLAGNAADADADATRLLTYIHAGAAAQHSVRMDRARHIAAGLLDHYSNQDSFWNMVHVGAAEEVRIADRGINRSAWQMVVPSIGSHLDESRRPGSARRILIRDLLMSSIGCGIAYGIGHENALYNLLHRPSRNIRFFLCSPLATVPVADRDDYLSPLDPGARFPASHERSAALAQLLVAMLGKARA